MRAPFHAISHSRYFNDSFVELGLAKSPLRRFRANRNTGRSFSSTTSTESGISTDLSETHSAKAPFSIDLIPVPKRSSLSPWRPANAFAPISRLGLRQEDSEFPCPLERAVAPGNANAVSRIFPFQVFRRVLHDILLSDIEQGTFLKGALILTAFRRKASLRVMRPTGSRHKRALRKTQNERGRPSRGVRR